MAEATVNNTHTWSSVSRVVQKRSFEPYERNVDFPHSASPRSKMVAVGMSSIKMGKDEDGLCGQLPDDPCP